MPGHRRGAVRTDVAGWSRPGSSRVMPRLECGSRRTEGGEPRRERDEVSVVTVAEGCNISAEVLTPEPKPSVASESTGWITRPRGIRRVPLVALGVEHRAREL